ncbi:sensor histidine kinase [Cohnella sp. 56]|uniref:sensor histidine kinase n=1 Tax=Cohnella sp. 56 TaxID=3113722 RepID=UPI00403FD38C
MGSSRGWRRTFCYPGFLKDEFLLFVIQNNGAGMTPKELAALRDSLTSARAAPEAGGDNGIGLANIDRRIKILYGERYGLVITSAPHEGTAVTVRVPTLPDGGAAAPPTSRRPWHVTDERVRLVVAELADRLFNRPQCCSAQTARRRSGSVHCRIRIPFDQPPELRIWPSIRSSSPPS